MFLIKLLRKLGKLIRGGVQPHQIVSGALLGVMIGMIPGFNLSLVVGIMLLLLLNAHVGIGLMGFALGKIGMYLLAPVTFQIGYLLIHNIGLEGLFKWFANTPVLALMDLQVYCLTGGIPIAIVVGLLFSWIMVRVVRVLQKGIIEATNRSDRMKKLANNKLVKLFMRIVFGKQKGTIEEMMKGKQPWFRKAGIILTAVVLVIIFGLQFFLLDFLFKKGLTTAVGMANGAEVNVTEADMSLFGGKAEITGLQITDPANPTHNSVQAQRLSADISMSNLLRKRYVVDLLGVSTVRFNEQRKSPGEVYEAPPEEPPVEEEEKTVYDYLEQAQTLRDYMTKLQKYLERRKTARKPEEKRKEEQKKQLFELADTHGYLGLSAKSMLTDQPTWIIRKVEVDGVRIPSLEQPQNLHAENVSSHPERVKTPMLFRMSPNPDAPPTGLVEFNLYDAETMNSLKLDLSGISLEGGSGLSDEVPVNIGNGQAGLMVEGRFSADQIDFPFTINLSQLQAQAREGESVLGMDPETAQQVFDNVDTMKIVGGVEGSFTSPRVKLNLEETLKSLKGALGDAAKKKLIETGRKQLEEETGKALKGVLGGKDEEKEDGDGNGEQEEKDQKDEAVDKIKGLF